MALSMDFINSTLIVTMVMAVFSIGYSIYMAFLNHKQAKAIDLIDKSNKYLLEITQEIKQIRQRMGDKNG